MNYVISSIPISDLIIRVKCHSSHLLVNNDPIFSVLSFVSKAEKILIVKNEIESYCI